MLKQLRYFQSVVRRNSFSEAAEENFISQSAISQQVQALERELGFKLLERRNRSFTLTPAGAYFYQKSLILTADYERMCSEAARIAMGDRASLKIGYLRGYTGTDLHRALELFSEKHPDVEVSVTYGSHEELYGSLRTGEADLVLNDQRRAFSDEYVNLLLTTCRSCIEVSAHSPIAQMERISPPELKKHTLYSGDLRGPAGHGAGILSRRDRLSWRVLCGNSGGSAIDGDRAQGLSSRGRNGTDSAGGSIHCPRSAGARGGAHPAELLRVLEKGQFRLLCRRICRASESTV